MSEGMCYVAAKPGTPGYCAVSVDEPQYAKNNASTVAEWIREGLIVSRVSLDDAKTGLLKNLDYQDEKAKP